MMLLPLECTASSWKMSPALMQIASNPPFGYILQLVTSADGAETLVSSSLTNLLANRMILNDCHDLGQWHWLKKISLQPLIMSQEGLFFLFLLMNFKLEIGKQLHSVKFGQLCCINGGLDDKQMFLDFFPVVALCSGKPSFRIFPKAASWFTWDPVLSNCYTWDFTEMFTVMIHLIFNNMVWYPVTCLQCLEQIFGSRNVQTAIL